MSLAEKKMSPKEKEIYEKLKAVQDPEFGFSIVERGLVDEVKVEGNKAKILFHLTVPFCPPPFALHIGKEIKRTAGEVSGIEQVEVRVQNHINEEQINKALKES